MADTDVSPLAVSHAPSRASSQQLGLVGPVVGLRVALEIGLAVNSGNGYTYLK